MLLISGCGTSVSPTSVAGPPASNQTPAGAASGPTLGYVWSAADSTLRPLAGVPGAAVVGSSIVAAGKYTAGAASARLQLALLEDASGGVWLKPLSGTPQQIASGQPQALRFSFAATSDSAVAYAPGAPGILSLETLSTQARVAKIAAPSGLVSAAISDNGALAIATATSLAVSASGGAFGSPVTLGKFGGMSFLAAGSDLVYADAASNTVSRVSGAVTTVIASAKDGVSTPSSVAATVDQHWVAVLNQADGSLLRIDLTGAQAAQRLTCACTPTGLDPLAGNGVFALSAARLSSPIWALDAGTTAARTFFVPALQGQATAGGR
jgi:hypothetical protein